MEFLSVYTTDKQHTATVRYSTVQVFVFKQKKVILYFI